MRPPADPPSGELGQIGLAGDQSLDHRQPALGGLSGWMTQTESVHPNWKYRRFFSLLLAVYHRNGVNRSVGSFVRALAVPDVSSTSSTQATNQFDREILVDRRVRELDVL